MGPFSYLSMFCGFLLDICQLTERETIPGYLTCLSVCEMAMHVFSSVYRYQSCS